MSKKIIAIIVVVGVVLMAFVWGKGWYNDTIVKSEGVSSQWGNVETAYQFRNDLIPNIVEVAKNYAEFEQETLTGVIEARAKASSIQVDASNLTAEQIQQFSQAQGAVSSGLGRLLATYENYPDLKANKQFEEIQNQLDRTEARINVERSRYNETVKDYNLQIKQFPGNLFASFFNFNESPYFKAEAGAEKAPNVGDIFDK